MTTPPVPQFPGGAPTPRDMSALMQRAREFAAKSGELQKITGAGEAADGAVRVVVGPSGAIQDVKLTPRAMRLASEALSEALLEASRAAAGDAGVKVAAMTASLLPPGMTLPGLEGGIRVDIAGLNEMAERSSAMLDAFAAQVRRPQA